MAGQMPNEHLMMDVYEDFEVKGEIRIGKSQCAMIGRLRPEDMQPSKLKLKDPSKDVHVSHGIKDVMEELKGKNITSHRFNFRVTPQATHMLSLFHAYIYFDEAEDAFCVKLNMKGITPQRQVRFVTIATDTVDHKRDLFCRVDKEKKETGRFITKLNDGDILQLGMEEVVNRLRVTIYMGEDGDGVEPYLHLREEPDARHIPIMMKLWELTEKIDSLQDQMNVLATSVQEALDPEAVADLGMEKDDEMDRILGVENSNAKQVEVDKEYLAIGDEKEQQKAA